MLRKTEIVPWSKEWNKLYMKEAEILKGIFADEMINIFHIGSTSVQSIDYAKPIIDILIVVRDIEHIDLFNNKMSTFKYEARGKMEYLKEDILSKGRRSERIMFIFFKQVTRILTNI
nr:GrpB family protein [Bacillus ndiopicus]